MKNILIPTTLEADTVTAVETAIKQSQKQSCTIYLMLVTAMPQEYSAGAFIQSTRQTFTPAQYNILAKCSNLAATSLNCRLEVHNRIGVSTPLMRNLLKHFEIGLVLLLPSYKAEQARIHKDCCRILLNCKSPILHLSPENTDADFSNALYLEDEKTKIDVQELQHMMNSNFPVKIVSRATYVDGQNPNELAGIVASSIEQKNIGLVVQTRKAGKLTTNSKPKTSLTQSLGLPVLSLYDEAGKV